MGTIFTYQFWESEEEQNHRHMSKKRDFFVGAMFSTIGSFIGILTLVALDTLFKPDMMVIGSFGAQAVLIFATPMAPLAQPWNCLVGNMIGAFIGVSIRMLVAKPIYVTLGLAVSLTIGLQTLTFSLHPPGGATAFIAVCLKDYLKDVGFMYIVFPTLIGSVIHVFVAIVSNQLAKCVGVENRAYPKSWFPDEVKDGFQFMRQCCPKRRSCT